MREQSSSLIIQGQLFFQEVVIDQEHVAMKLAFLLNEFDQQRVESKVSLKYIALAMLGRFDHTNPSFPLNQETLNTRDDPNFRIQTALLWIRSATADSEGCQHDKDGEQRRLNNLSKTANSEQSIYQFKQTNNINTEHLHLHRDRLLVAAEQLEWHRITWLDRTEASLALIEAEINNHLAQLPPLPPEYIEHRKVRITVDVKGYVLVDSVLIGSLSTKLTEQPEQRFFIPSSLEDSCQNVNDPCKVCLDRQPSQPSLLTNHKTSHRHVYDSARCRAGFSLRTSPTAYEVLLYNHQNEVFDGSISTIYLKRSGIWITPDAQCGPVLGITRRIALESGLCKEACVKIEDLVENETIWLSNAVRGFFKGVLLTKY